MVGCLVDWIGVWKYYTDSAWHAPEGGKSRFFIVNIWAEQFDTDDWSGGLVVKKIIRDDLSDRLIHLTRGETHHAASTLLRVIAEARLMGGTGNIKARVPCVCFSEAPISKLAHILANLSSHGIRYKPFGVMVEKRWLFERGGRPVIYQPDTEYDLLPDELKYRHVKYDPVGHRPTDWSWEREWRIQTDELRLDPNCTTVIVPNRDWEDYITEHFSRRHNNFGTWITNRIPLPDFRERPRWHLIVLEDLGVPFPPIEPPG